MINNPNYADHQNLFCEEVNSKHRDVCNDTHLSIGCPETRIFGFLGAMFKLCDTFLGCIRKTNGRISITSMVTETLLDETALFQAFVFLNHGQNCLFP